VTPRPGTWRMNWGRCSDRRSGRPRRGAVRRRDHGGSRRVFKSSSALGRLRLSNWQGPRPEEMPWSGEATGRRGSRLRSSCARPVRGGPGTPLAVATAACAALAGGTRRPSGRPGTCDAACHRSDLRQHAGAPHGGGRTAPAEATAGYAPVRPGNLGGRAGGRADRRITPLGRAQAPDWRAAADGALAGDPGDGGRLGAREAADPVARTRSSPRRHSFTRYRPDVGRVTPLPPRGPGAGRGQRFSFPVRQAWAEGAGWPRPPCPAARMGRACANLVRPRFGGRQAEEHGRYRRR